MKTLLKREMFYGDEMRARRKAAGLSVRELSKRSGIDKGMISKYESRKRFPSLQTFIVLENCIRNAMNDKEKMNGL